LTDDIAESAETEQAVTPATEEKSLADEILEPIIVSEDITKRGEHEKHFLCDDGSYIAVSYPQAVHEQVDGEWVDIEYDVTADGNGISPVDDTIKVKFANNTNSAKLVKLESGDYKISWTVEAENENGDITEKVKLSKDSKATLKTSKELLKDKKEKIKNNAKHTVEEVFDIKNNAKKTIEKLKTADTDVLKNNETVLSTNEAIQSYNCDRIQSILFAQSNIEYVGAFGEGTALRYIMSTGNINEEVVLESYNGFKSYSMVIDTDGLIPVKDEFGRIELVDKNENVIMMIKAPYMYDANDIISEDIEVTVTQESKKEWRITYTPDKEWLTDKERKYPVVIDPTVTTANYAQTNLLDTYVRSTQTAPYNNSSPHLYVGYNGGENWTYWGVKNLPGMNSVTTVTGASFNIRLLNGTSTMGRIGLYFVSSAITTSTMQWSNKPSIGTKLGEISTIPGDLWLRYSSNELGDKLRTYYRANWTDFGFALKYEAQINDWNQFYSSDYTGNGGANIPYLEVRYTTNFEAVTEGTYYIQNVYTGKYLCASGSSVYLSDYGNGGTAVKWTVQKNAYYPSTYNIVPNGNTSLGLYFNMDYGTITLPAKASDGFGRWQFEKLDNGMYLILSAGRPWMSLTGSGTSVYPYATHTGTSQQWQITTTPPQAYSQAIESGLYYIKNLYENKYLTYDTKIEVNDYAASSAQRWQVLKNTDNTYTIYPEDDSNYGIGVYGGLAVDEQVLSCSVGNPIASQKMYLIDQGNGSYSLVPATNSIYRVGVYTDMSETKTIGGVAQTMVQNKTACLELNSSSNTQKWVFEATTDKKAVILIHGRVSNSLGCWGASNSIKLGDNDHYAININGTSIGDIPKLYTDVNSQWLTGQTLDNNISVGAVFNEGYDNGELVSAQDNSDHEGNLAYHLKQQGYIENVNLFVFNYPNEDVVKNSALKLQAYVSNLISYVKTSGSSEMKHAFGIHGDDYSFNIVGHSMGGLVARYYIENLYNDEYVEKLVTIDTPHWGSGYADVSNDTEIKHVLCDHDLDRNSAMYGGNNPVDGDCDDYEPYSFSFTNSLNYSNDRSTKYYAIAGVDFKTNIIDQNDYAFEIPTTFTTFTQIETFLKNYNAALDMDVQKKGDNIVGFMSQIGWQENPNGDEPIKKIAMEKIFVNFDTNGGIGTDDFIEMVHHFHGKNQHRTEVITKVFEYLQE
ncbi:MAG: DNRLRE domain-containing protein, partial [Clostridia bacterium]|nr:DNRLRE domain-containing protein [Clostridia bacterium]